MGSSGSDDQGAAVFVKKLRSGFEAARIVRDADDVDLAREPMGLTDLTCEEPLGRSGQSITSTTTFWPSR